MVQEFSDTGHTALYMNNNIVIFSVPTLEKVAACYTRSMVLEPQRNPQDAWFSWGAILFPRVCLAMSEDIFNCHTVCGGGGTTGSQ